MINFINKYLDKRNKNKQDLIDQANSRANVRRKNQIAEIIALRLIAIKNSSYIRSSINVINGIINHAKGVNAADTKRKREYLRSRVSWLQRNQREEEWMISHYNSLLLNI